VERGDLHEAYELLATAHQRWPDNEKIRRDQLRLGTQIVSSLLDQVRDLDSHDLVKQEGLLRQAASFDSDVKSSVERRLAENADEMDAVMNRLTRCDIENFECAIATAANLTSYARFVPQVREQATRVSTRRSELDQLVDRLIHADLAEAALLYLELSEEVWPQDSGIALKEARLAHELCGTLRASSERFADASLPASALFQEIRAAAFCSDEEALLRVIEETADGVTRNYSPVVFVDSNFPQQQHSELVRELASELQSGDVRPHAAPGATGMGDLSLVVLVRDVAIEEDVSTSQPFSKFLAGHQQIANENFDRLLIDYNNAQRNYAVAQAQNNAFGIGFWGARSGAIAKQLRQTPKYFQQPVYGDYQYTRNVYRFRPTVRLQYELWDHANRRVVIPDSVGVSEAVESVEILGVHPSDSNGISEQSVSHDAAERVLRDARTRAQERVAESVSSALALLYEGRARFALDSGHRELAREYVLAQWFLEQGSHQGGVWRFSEEEARNADAAFDELADRFAQKHAGGWEGGRLAPTAQLWTNKINERLDDSVEVVWEAWIPEAPPTESVKLLAASRPDRRVSVAAALGGSGRVSQGSRTSNAVARMVEKVSPSIVMIRTFEGTGTGFIVHRSGLVVTSDHVVGQAGDIIVKFADGRKFMAELVERSVSRDLAVLKISGDGSFASLRIGDSGALSPGEPVIAIGGPGGVFEQTVTKGIVSAIRLLPSPNNPELNIRVIQTDAAVSPGSSGGPLLNMKGEAVGVVAMKSFGKGQEGLGFAIATEEMRNAFAALP